MFNQDFYFQTTRKYVSLFGTIFSEINIIRTNSTENYAYIRVPITYAQKEKMLARVQQAVEADRETAAFTLPVMSFEITGIKYASDRKLTTTGRSAYIKVGSPSRLSYMYNPVPYDIGFSLYVWVKNPEDGTKIIEQILPYFTPAFTVQTKLIPGNARTDDIAIVLDSINQENAYQTDLKQNQAIIWTLNFTLKGTYYGPMKSAPIILFANTNLRAPDPQVEMADAIGNTGIISYTHVHPGQDANGHATSNADISVAANVIYANSDFGYITSYGGPLGEAIFLTADTVAWTDDHSFTVDQLTKHNY